MQDKIFSPTEQGVLEKITKKPQKISDIASSFFKGKKKPIDPNAVVSGAVLNINKKCNYNKLDWKIASEGLGRGGKSVWIEVAK